MELLLRPMPEVRKLFRYPFFSPFVIPFVSCAASCFIFLFSLYIFGMQGHESARGAHPLDGENGKF